MEPCLKGIENIEEIISKALGSLILECRLNKLYLVTEVLIFLAQLFTIYNGLPWPTTVYQGVQRKLYLC